MIVRRILAARARRRLARRNRDQQAVVRSNFGRTLTPEQREANTRHRHRRGF